MRHARAEASPTAGTTAWCTCISRSNEACRGADCSPPACALTPLASPRTLPATAAGALGWRNRQLPRQGRRRGAARVPRFTVLGSYQSLQLKSEHYDVSARGEGCLARSACRATTGSVPLVAACCCCRYRCQSRSPPTCGAAAPGAAPLQDMMFDTELAQAMGLSTNQVPALRGGRRSGCAPGAAAA